MITEINWENLPENRAASYTTRAKVPGGWLVNSRLIGNYGFCESMTFVPDPDHKWESTDL
jgi:hypothetical protein